MNVLKQQYNKQLERYYRGIRYMENNPKALENQKYISAISEIMDNLDILIKEIEKQGYTMTDTEILNGFILEKWGN